MKGGSISIGRRDLFKAAGTDFDATEARRRHAKTSNPWHLTAKATIQLTNTVREVESRNVVAKLEGSDPQLADQYVVYTAHWDHLGRDSTLTGDQIFNGAVDNAGGTAGLLEIAEAYSRLKPAPKRSILFLSVTAEEFGLLGAKYYATVPLYPLARTLAVINMDGLNQWGRTKDVVVDRSREFDAR